MNTPAPVVPVTTGWWNQPFRIFQTNLREIDAALDERKVVQQIRDLGANAWLLNTAGIVSFYPSKLPFQHPSPWLRERQSGDLIGDAVREAHANDVRVISRADFSKVHQDVYEAHPDWCFVSATGQHQIYNGFYSTCPSGPYYQEKSFEILGEVLERYPVDGFFFNWFNFSQRDYSGTNHGICQCVHCRRRFTERYDLELPAAEDWSNPAYLRWREYTRETLEDLAGRIRSFIKERNPNVCLILRQNPDVIMHEVNNAVDRPLPLWVYWAGEVTRESRTAHPDKPVVINAVMFLDLPYRFSAEQPGLVGLHLAQTIAQGVNPYAYVVGTPDQPDCKNFPMVRTMLHFHRDNEAYYAGLRSAAKVAIISSLRSEERYGRAEGVAKVQKARRGAFRALVESHIPFDILPDDLIVAAARDRRLDRYDALVLPNVATLDDEQLAALDAYVERGGGLVATYDTAAFDAEGKPRAAFGLRSLGAARVLARREGPGAMRSAYLRLQPGEIPGFADTDFVALDRAFLYVEPRPDATAAMTLIPPSRYGPPEKTYWDIETDQPGLLWQRYGQGRTAYFPWPVDALFFDLSLPEHRALLAHAVEQVSKGGRQVVTNAPPQVEVVVGEQQATGRTILHLINYSGHQERSFHDPLEIRDIRLEVAAPSGCTRAFSVQLGEALPAQVTEGRLTLTLPRLGLFDMVVLE